jgi:hypothetical protein
MAIRGDELGPYRTAQIVAVERKDCSDLKLISVSVSGGRLYQRKQCRPPSALWQWWYNVSRGDEWVCALCGTRWVHNGNAWQSEGLDE